MKPLTSPSFEQLDVANRDEIRQLFLYRPFDAVVVGSCGDGCGDGCDGGGVSRPSSVSLDLEVSHYYTVIVLFEIKKYDLRVTAFGAT